ncbi:helicase associated domain-containing protein [Streptomyces sp. 900116325]
MVWEPGDEAWENKLAALRSYHRATGHLAPRQDAVWGEGEAMVPIGQHMANLRRKNGSAKTRSGPRLGPRSSRKSIRTGTAPGRSTGNGITASTPTWSTPTGCCPTSSPASCTKATTSASGFTRKQPGT